MKICYQMSYFKAKMYQIRFRLVLHLISCFGCLWRSLRSSQLDLRGLLREEEKREQREWVEWEGEGRVPTALILLIVCICCVIFDETVIDPKITVFIHTTQVNHRSFLTRQTSGAKSHLKLCCQGLYLEEDRLAAAVGQQRCRAMLQAATKETKQEAAKGYQPR